MGFKLLLALLVLCVYTSDRLCTTSTTSSSRRSGPYKPTWDSLDKRPLPGWYDEAKIGIFIHWGVFSVPSLLGSNFWPTWKQSRPGSFYHEYMKANYRADWTYADFAKDFKADLFDAQKWVDLFEDAGAKYMVFVTKHHEGFCNWNTNYSFNWNSMEVGPKRDIVGELATALRKKQTMKLGLYHSLFEWFNPLYLMDLDNNYQTQIFVKGKTIPELHELVNTYEPDLLWSDGNWMASDDYFASKEFLAWLYNESPVKDKVVVNDRWGNNTQCKHGDYLTCNDRYLPKVLQKKKFEMCDSIQTNAWGLRRDTELANFLSIHDIITRIAQTISCGGNYLLNVGPTSDGRIMPIFEERLRQMGAWLKINGEAVYGSKPWVAQNDSTAGNVWYTKAKSNSSSTGYSVYAFVLEWPDNNELNLGSIIYTPSMRVSMLGYNGRPFKIQQNATAGVTVTFPFIQPNHLPSFTAWVLKFDNLTN